jgi:hypothetical protein
MRQIKLYISNVRPHAFGHTLIGEADVGAAITDRNTALADKLAAALRQAGYFSALLVLDAEDLPNWGLPEPAAPKDEIEAAQ